MLSRRRFLTLLGAACVVTPNLSLPTIGYPDNLGWNHQCKIDMVRRLIEQGIQSHDDLIEQAIFSGKVTSLPFDMGGRDGRDKFGV